MNQFLKLKKKVTAFIALMVILFYSDTSFGGHCVPQGTWVVTDPSGTVVWPFSMSVIDNVVVPNGITLIVDPNVVIDFMENATITIQPGGKMYLYGTLQLSPSCACTWGGIRVEGDETSCQRTQFQGYLRTKNAVISGASIAIGADGGAMVNCEKTEFLNNRFDVHMLPYNPPNGCVPGCNNSSNFTQCNFTWTQPVCNAIDFETHVVLDGVYLVDFLGCEFSNFYPPLYGPGNRRGTGLKATNASFTMTQYGTLSLGWVMNGCYSNNPWQCTHMFGGQNIFYSLDIGIDANWAAGGQLSTCLPTAINGSMFQDNGIAIETSDETQLTVTNCNFFYDKNTSHFFPRPINFIIAKYNVLPSALHYFHNNSFVSNESKTIYMLLESHTNQYMIYKNKFKFNPDILTSPANSAIGIQLHNCVLDGNYIDCNTFIDINNDIFVDQGPGGNIMGATVCKGPLQPIAIRCEQFPSPLNYATNNVLSVCPGAGYNIVNNTSNTVNYYIPNSSACTFNVNLITGDPNPCSRTCVECDYGFDFDADPPIKDGNKIAQNERPQDEIIKIYPSPAKDNITIMLPEWPTEFSISLIDMQGRLVSSFVTTETQMVVNIENLPAGLYVAKIQNESYMINEIRKLQIIR
jgi:hypothetical protein